jgi:subtilisin family serine protease
MNRFTGFFMIIAVVAVLVSSCSREDELSGTGNEVELKSAAVAQNNFVPNEMLVKFKDGVNENQKTAVLSKVNGKVKEKILTKMMEKAGDKQGVELISLPGAALEAIAKVKGLEEIEYAEPNYIYEHCATSNDTYFTNGSLWGMYGTVTTPANQFGSHAAVAWAAGKTGSNTVFVGIIDEGYMYTHVDLAANAGTNPGEIAGNGIDDDSNGYKDDVYGWDFDGKNNTVYDGTADDHGTHVAGTIGAVGGNGIGVAGVVWNVKLLSAKFLGANGGTTANAILAVDYFTNLKTRNANPVNIVATNNSWGGGGFSQGLQDAIQRANAAGILFIAAAGNEKKNIDRRLSYPAAYPNSNIISVASITSTGALSSFSNYGATNVDLGAPGSGIWSTLPGNTYGSYSGTSMATPHVTGAVVLYKSLNPDATSDQIKTAILNGTPTSSLAGKCLTGDRLNVSSF